MIENEKIEEMMMELEEKSENTINALENDYSAIRTGRANPKILDKIEVEAYGGMSKLIELGNVAALDARCLQINLWDKSLLKAVEKAILVSDLGLNPATSGTTIRVPMPALTEETRKGYTRQARQEAENARVAIRNIRRDALAQLKDLVKEKEISEDEERRGADEIQKLTDHAVEEADKLLASKETDLMAV